MSLMPELPPPPTSARGIDRDRLLAVVEPIARAHGAEIVDVEWKSEPGGWVLRLYVEKVGSAAGHLSAEQASVGLELCSAVSRDLSPALDVANLISHRYTLEVSTPGVERPLRRPNDYLRFAGQKAKLRLSSPLLGQKVVTGVLRGMAGSSVRFDIDGTGHEIPLRDIVSGHLVFEFGPAPKPGRPGKRK
jgi:ribosome maturation factor RimP